MPIDIRLTTDGELVLSDNGDLATCWGDDMIAQEILSRLKTQKGDFLLDPDMGASLERFIGQSNEDYVHRAIEAVVLEEILKDGLIYGATVECVPTDPNGVVIVVEFSSTEEDDRVIQVNAGLDLRKGLVYARVGVREG